MFLELHEREKCSYTTAVWSTGVLQLQALQHLENRPSLSFASVLPTYLLTPQCFSSCVSPKASLCYFINRELATLLNMESHVIHSFRLKQRKCFRALVILTSDIMPYVYHLCSPIVARMKK